jgi:hypothetical protein
LRILAHREGGRLEEVFLHAYFRAKRVRGEWFRFCRPERAAYRFTLPFSELSADQDARYFAWKARYEARQERHWTPEFRETLNNIMEGRRVRMLARNARA